MGILTVNSDFEKLFGVTEKEYYTKQYLTFEALGDCTFTFYYPNDIGTSDSPILTHISYSVDNGETWVTEEFEPETEKTVTPPLIKKGETILWKADGCTFDYNDGDNCYFSSDEEYNVYGNIMSLIYEDDFADKNALLEGHSFGNLFEANDIVSAENLVLPATTLTQNCYDSMFLECMALTTGPTLPATTLTSGCYNSMFAGCGGLNFVKMLATDISASGCLDGWIYSDSETTGTLIINKDYEGFRSALNVPATWTILNEDGTPHIFPRDYSEEYLTFECVDNGGNFDFNIPLGGTDFDVSSVSYSLDNGQNWTTYENEGDDISIELYNLSAGDKILLKGIAIMYASQHLSYDSPSEDYSNIHLTGDWLVYGNIMSLFYGDNFVDKTSFPKDGFANSKYNCAGLFFQNDECNMGDLSNLILPATTLTENCYYMMFADCPAITKAPELPATTLANYCYMFHGCTSLTTAPVLPATTLARQCYTSMFHGCSNLNYIKAMFITTPSLSYTTSWVYGVAATGTFVKNSAATWNVTDTFGVPTGWTVETA